MAAAAAIPAAAPLPDAPWPEGNRVDAPQDPEIAALLRDPALTGPGMRAVVVVRDGRIVGEIYGQGFSAETPLLGWSMAKTVTAAIIGTVVAEGKMAVADKGLSAGWTDGRAAIGVGDLMAMSSGLEFNEDYGDVTDVTRMLYLEPDMAAFAAAKPLSGKMGGVFSYSSGTPLVLSRLWQDRVGADAARMAADKALRADRHDKRCPGNGCARHLRRFVLPLRYGARLGQASVNSCFRTESGTAGRSCRQALSPGCARPPPPRTENTGSGQLWLRGPQGGLPEDADPDAGLGLPEDTFWLEGHDGQSVAVVPSKRLSRRTHGPDAVEARLQAAGAGGSDSKAVGVEASAGRDQRFVSTACTA